LNPPFRPRLACLVALLAVFGAPSSSLAQPSATPSPAQPASSPAPAPSPAPSPHFLRFGYGFTGLDAEVAPSIVSEFQTTPSATNTTISYWGLGDFIVWKFRIFGETDYRAYSYAHAAANPVTVVGPASGQTIVPAFTARESELERSGGLELGRGFYIGGAIFGKYNNYGYSALNGFGYGLGRAPVPGERISPYFAFFYYPNVGGNVATPDGKLGFSYRGAHYRVGSLFEIGPSRFYLDAGFIGTRFASRASAPGYVSDSAGYAGLGYRI
jgi:hypothetical protein